MVQSKPSTVCSRSEVWSLQTISIPNKWSPLGSGGPCFSMTPLRTPGPFWCCDGLSPPTGVRDGWEVPVRGLGRRLFGGTRQRVSLTSDVVSLAEVTPGPVAVVVVAGPKRGGRGRSPHPTDQLVRRVGWVSLLLPPRTSPATAGLESWSLVLVFSGGKEAGDCGEEILSHHYWPSR